MKLAGKTVVVTGGGNGMGRQLVLQLLKKGARVAAVDINGNALEETMDMAGENHSKMSMHVVNIANKDEVSALPDAVKKEHGNVDGLINNAGIVQPFVKIMDLEMERIERVFQVNFWGLVYMTRAFLPELVNRPEAHIVNTSSMGGFLPVPGQTAYGASKAAVKLFTEGLRLELMKTPVKVSVVFPGAIATNITGNSGVATNTNPSDQKESNFKMLQADTAAGIILNGMEKDKYHILVGQDAKMMDFLSRLAPGFAAKTIYSQMASLLSD